MFDFSEHIKRVTLLGVDHTTKEFDKVKIEIVNLLCLLSLICWVFNNMLGNFSAGFYLNLFIAIPLLISFLIPLYLNKINKTSLARVVLIATVAFSLSVMYFVKGTQNYYEFLFLLLFILILFLLENVKTKWILSVFVFLAWLFPYIYTSFNKGALEETHSAGVFEIVFLGVMTAIYLISKKTVEQINTSDFKQEQHIAQQKSVLNLIAFHNQELENKGKELIEKNEEIEVFFKMSSEYLKQPTKKLISLSQSLESSLNCESTSLAKELFSIINHSAIRMNELIEAVFEYSAISKDSPKETIDTNQVLDEIFEDMQNTISSTNSNIKKLTALPQLYANKVEIRMLFQNLISNAIKYAKKGVSPEIEIDSNDIGTHWQISIKDNGIGIDEAHLKNVFNMFHKLHNHEEYAGSGIGLSHCKKIVDLLGGKIWVESTPGIGTTVVFTCLKSK